MIAATTAPVSDESKIVLMCVYMFYYATYVSFHLLFSSGCKINARNILGQTALMKAVQDDNIDTLAVLYNAGITINCIVFCIATVNRGGSRKIAPSGGRHQKKITILRQKIIFFPILGGARTGCAPLDPPLVKVKCFVAISRTTGTAYYSECLIQPTVFHVLQCSVFYVENYQSLFE